MNHLRRIHNTAKHIACRFVLLPVLLACANGAYAWDHPSHMITAAIAFEEIEHLRPDLMERIGLILMKHPDSAPFWVAATDAASRTNRAAYTRRGLVDECVVPRNPYHEK